MRASFSSYELPSIPLIPGTDEPGLTREEKFKRIGDFWQNKARTLPDVAPLAETAFAIAKNFALAQQQKTRGAIAAISTGSVSHSRQQVLRVKDGVHNSDNNKVRVYIPGSSSPVAIGRITKH